MRVFKDQCPNDLISLEMRVIETQRHMLQQMFVSSEETKKLLEVSLESAIKNIDLPGMMEKYAKESIESAVKGYFSYGEGQRIITESVNNALSLIIPKLFSKAK